MVVSTDNVIGSTIRLYTADSIVGYCLGPCTSDVICQLNCVCILIYQDFISFDAYGWGLSEEKCEIRKRYGIGRVEEVCRRVGDLIS